MLNLLEAIKIIIDRYIITKVQLSVNVDAGDTVIPVTSSRRFSLGDQVALYDQEILDTVGEGEVGIVKCLPNTNSLELCEPIGEGYSSTSTFIEKMVGGKFFEGGVFIGDPAKMARYPAISINAKEKSNEWLTLESTGEQFSIDISVFTKEADYEESYRMMHIYVKRIEMALFRSLYPLVRPFDVVQLSEDVLATDTVFRIDEPNNFPLAQLGWIWFESADYLRPGKVIQIVGQGVFELSHAIGRPFSAGDNVIRPRRHFYDAFPRGIRYGTVNRETVVLKAAVISYQAKEEVRRHWPYIDPLTF